MALEAFKASLDRATASNPTSIQACWNALTNSSTAPEEVTRIWLNAVQEEQDSAKLLAYWYVANEIMQGARSIAYTDAFLKILGLALRYTNNDVKSKVDRVLVVLVKRGVFSQLAADRVRRQASSSDTQEEETYSAEYIRDDEDVGVPEESESEAALAAAAAAAAATESNAKSKREESLSLPRLLQRVGRLDTHCADALEKCAAASAMLPLDDAAMFSDLEADPPKVTNARLEELEAAVREERRCLTVLREVLSMALPARRALVGSLEVQIGALEGAMDSAQADLNTCNEMGQVLTALKEQYGEERLETTLKTRKRVRKRKASVEADGDPESKDSSSDKGNEGAEEEKEAEKEKEGPRMYFNKALRRYMPVAGVEDDSWRYR